VAESASSGVDSLLRQASAWTPREATVFLIQFEERFRLLTGRSASRVERQIVTSLLRRRAAQDP
jgi:hypothetical protein